MTEEWRPITRVNGAYEVSSQGRVRNRATGHILSPDLVKGYRRVTMYSGGRVRVTVHRLVCEAWHGPPPPGALACHRNDEPLDNRPENLHWGTPKSNVREAVENRKHRNSRKTHCPSGHAYDAGNTKVKPNGWRLCKVCQAGHSRTKSAKRTRLRKEGLL